jgi:hypothetical protein
MVMVFPFALALTLATSAVDHLRASSRGLQPAFADGPEHWLRLSVGRRFDTQGNEWKSFLLLPNAWREPGVYDVEVGAGASPGIYGRPVFRPSWLTPVVYLYAPLLGTLLFSLPVAAVAVRRKRPPIDPAYDPRHDPEFRLHGTDHNDAGS